MSQDDTRPRVQTNGKTINLLQLSTEVGTALCASSTEVVVADPASPVTVTQLQSALTAHTADPTFGLAAEDKQVVNARSKAQAVLAGTDTFTVPELQRIAAAIVLRATR